MADPTQTAASQTGLFGGQRRHAIKEKQKCCLNISSPQRTNDRTVGVGFIARAPFLSLRELRREFL